MWQRTAVLLLCLAVPVVTVAAPGKAQVAQHTGVVIEAVRTGESVRIDGVLDEPVWRRAQDVPIPWETYPGDNLPAPVKTECRIAYSRDALYVAFVAHDPDPSKIRAHLTDRDRAFNDDFVGIVLDTFHDQRRAFEFFVNPMGVQMDVVLDDVNGGEDASWDAIWRSAGRLTKDGYVVEMAIPFSSLRFPRGQQEQTWGIDILRVYPRDQRYMFRSQRNDRDLSCQLCQISELKGLEGIEPGHQLELDPTLVSSMSAERESFPDGSMKTNDPTTELGLTARWGVTPNATVSATINPDFSQVEADAAQLDINRTFALFYPEKRPFFMEGSDYFDTPMNVVYTRMIEKPSWGLKYTSKAGRNTIGALVARDDVTNLIFPGSEGSSSGSLGRSNVSGIFRYRRDLGTTSTLGFLSTGRNGDGYHNAVAGIDGTFRLGKSDTVTFQALGSSTGYPRAISEDYGQPDRSFTGGAFDLEYGHDTKSWSWDATYRNVSGGFRADLGFMPRGDYRFGKVRGSHTWWGEKGAFFSRVRLGANYDRMRTQSGSDLYRAAELWASFSARAQTHGFINLSSGDQWYNGRRFSANGGMIFLSTSPASSFSFRLFASIGDGIDYVNTRPGDQVTIRPGIVWRPGRHLNLDLSSTYQTLDVSGGRLFRASLSELRLVYQLTVRTFARAILQYQDIDRSSGLYDDPDVQSNSRSFFVQLLFSYKVNPQTVFFLGYSEGRQGWNGIDMLAADRTIFLKIGYAWLL
ncbi:MAG: carbohydrate binding family 9 domain-containing protein [Acidobacteria bacterium]|nr:carbohydrate binding family 9 domain-containing protein [Acidobacteriota bacterium]